MENYNKGFTIKDLLIRLILIIVFIFLLIWLFPMPDLKPLNNQIFLDNIDRMKNVAKTYYTLERLPQNINDYKKMSLQEMLEKKLILPLMDSNGNYCSEEDSYIQITKLENEYIIKVNLSCSDKQDYIIEHFGCYDICSDKCEELATTQPITTGSGGSGVRTTKYTGTTTKRYVPTTKPGEKLYEYQFMKNECTNHFDKYVCPKDYYLVGNTCIKNGSKVVTVPAKKEVVDVTSTDSKPAIPVINSTTEKKPAICKIDTKVDTIDADYTESEVDKVFTGYKIYTASKKTTEDIKLAKKVTETIKEGYQTEIKYDVITAKKTATTSKQYVGTVISTKGNLAYSNANEELKLVDWWEELVCDHGICTQTIKKYKYYRYKKVTKYTYSCDSFPGYSKYGVDKCRKAITKKACANGRKDVGDGCVYDRVSIKCDHNGPGYEFNKQYNACVKKNTTYYCPSGMEPTQDKKYCKKKVYGCPPSSKENSNGKCIKKQYSCPPNTDDKKYTLVGSKCILKHEGEVCTCPVGTIPSLNKKECIKINSNTTYSCKAYPGYILDGKKCTKTITSQKETYKCDAGYVKDGTNCVKTECTTDTKKADETYRQVCEQKYKWSTRTHLDGWTYTGNKRQIN